jgi:hypothetical protein
MSIGVGGYGKIVLQDKNTVIYEYGSYNLNDSQFFNNERVCDGLIVIDKSGLVEPKIREKIKRLPNGKKKIIIKRISKAVPYQELYDVGKIRIENCSNCWKSIGSGYDYIACKLVYQIFQEYQEKGCLSEYISYNV